MTAPFSSGREAFPQGVAFKRPNLVLRVLQRDLPPSSSSKFSGLAQALSPVTVKPFFNVKQHTVTVVPGKRGTGPLPALLQSVVASRAARSAPLGFESPAQSLGRLCSFCAPENRAFHRASRLTRQSTRTAFSRRLFLCCASLKHAPAERLSAAHAARYPIAGFAVERCCRRKTNPAQSFWACRFGLRAPVVCRFAKLGLARRLFEHQFLLHGFFLHNAAQHSGQRGPSQASLARPVTSALDAFTVSA